MRLCVILRVGDLLGGGNQTGRQKLSLPWEPSQEAYGPAWQTASRGQHEGARSQLRAGSTKLGHLDAKMRESLRRLRS